MLAGESSGSSIPNLSIAYIFGSVVGEPATSVAVTSSPLNLTASLSTASSACDVSRIGLPCAILNKGVVPREVLDLLQKAEAVAGTAWIKPIADLRDAVENPPKRALFSSNLEVWLKGDGELSRRRAFILTQALMRRVEEWQCNSVDKLFHSMLSATFNAIVDPAFPSITRILKMEKKCLEQIRAGEKQVEGRSATNKMKRVQPGDVFRCVCGNEDFCITVHSVRWYPTFVRMLTAEGLDNYMPGCKSLAVGKQMYPRFFDYRSFPNGVLAFRLSRDLPSDVNYASMEDDLPKCPIDQSQSRGLEHRHDQLVESSLIENREPNTEDPIQAQSNPCETKCNDEFGIRMQERKIITLSEMNIDGDEGR